MRGAAERGNVLRYVASFSAKERVCRLSAALREVGKDSPLGMLKGTANLVKIVTHLRAPADCPHIIQAKGAGVGKTAAALRADLLRFLPDCTANFS